MYIYNDIYIYILLVTASPSLRLPLNITLVENGGYEVEWRSQAGTWRSVTGLRGYSTTSVSAATAGCNLSQASRCFDDAPLLWIS